MRPVLVVSPHLDDAVLSTGQFLAGRPNAVVVTLFAGHPPEGTATDYDRKCGFTDSLDAVATRRDEDVNALAILRATPMQLDYLDQQYGEERDLGGMVIKLKAVIRAVAPEFVLAPLGLLHPDHVIARDVTTVAVAETIGKIVFYEELPYRVTHPEAVTAALATVGPVSPAFIGDGRLHRKMAAIWSYRSQMDLPEFENIHNLLVPERYWRAA